MRFTISWKPDTPVRGSGGQYKVSIPMYDGGEVVTADEYDRLHEALTAVAALDGVRVDENNPDVYFVPVDVVRRIATNALSRER